MNSQVATKKDSVKIDFRTAYLMNIDLIDYDRLIENKVELNLNKCLLLNKSKDTIIKDFKSLLNVSNNRLKIASNRLELLNVKIKNKPKKKSPVLVWTIGGVSVGIIGTLLLLR